VTYETILYEKKDGYCLITLNRPQSLNALNVQMWKDISSALDEIEKDDEIKVFIFTGAPRPDGRPCFCPGGDLKEMATFVTADGSYEIPANKAPSPSSSLWAHRRPRRAEIPTIGPHPFERILWSPKISIAAIDGVCTAGGIELATCCDIILASETAQISDMHVKNLGWLGGAGSPVNVAWKIGVSKAIEFCCTGDVIDGKEAYRIGLANHVFPPGKLLEEARQLGMKLGSMRLGALTMTKAVCRSIEDMDRRSSWSYNDDAHQALLNDPDSAEWGPMRWIMGR
jgi:enoyl-CoA hydratase/carnithine racemase